MKISLATALVSLGAAVFAPVQAEPLVVGPHGVEASARSVAVPEAPIAAFERLLAAGVSRLPSLAIPRVVDPLDALFHAALWSAPAPSRLATAAGRPSDEVRQ